MSRYVLLIIVLIATALCIAPVSAQIERTIAQDPDGSIIVTLQLPDEWIGGIVEVIPPGFTYLDSTHPADQIETDGQKLYLAVIGEHTVTYRISGDGTPEISGTVLDLRDGTRSSEHQPVQSSAPLLPAVLLVVIIACCAWRRS